MGKMSSSPFPDFHSLKSEIANLEAAEQKKRQPGERQGAIAADVLFLAKEGFLDFSAAAQEELALQSFLKALTPENLQQHVLLTTLVSLEQALAQAKLVEAVLHWGSRGQFPTQTCRAGVPTVPHRLPTDPTNHRETLKGRPRREIAVPPTCFPPFR
ncbi:hypothetical protein EOD39_7144 [Acipenser ruthenus]|uniref:Uncharacterized protein n=1 Tax=Acipenser ruthenus TaxID=7906 RepID=A0A662YXE0_ACIRT|nr:hypothetical protein EOD39_7144 [Acipenser ruthenus]